MSTPQPPDPAPPNGRRQGEFWRAVIAFFIGLSLLVGVGSFAFHHLAIQPATSLPGRIAEALAKITRAEVTIEADTVTVSQADVTELALVLRNTQTLVKFESEVFGSENVLIVRGDFIVKAGFDLSKPFAVHFNEATGEIEPEFPPAEVLSVEMTGFEVVHSQDGFWNKVRPQHQEAVTQQLLDQANAEALRSDIRAEAEAKLATRLLDLLGHPAGLEPLTTGEPVVP